MTPLHYSINIQWSYENQAFLVDVPELSGCHTHGDRYEGAIKNAVEVIELWIETAKESGQSIPAPKGDSLAKPSSKCLYNAAT